MRASPRSRTNSSPTEAHFPRYPSPSAAQLRRATSPARLDLPRALHQASSSLLSAAASGFIGSASVLLPPPRGAPPPSSPARAARASISSSLLPVTRSDEVRHPPPSSPRRAPTARAPRAPSSRRRFNGPRSNGRRFARRYGSGPTFASTLARRFAERRRFAHSTELGASLGASAIASTEAPALETASGCGLFMARIPRLGFPVGQARPKLFFRSREIQIKIWKITIQLQKFLNFYRNYFR